MDSMDLETMTDMALNKIADLARQAADLQRDKRALEHLLDKREKEIRELKTLLSVERQQ